LDFYSGLSRLHQVGKNAGILGAFVSTDLDKPEIPRREGPLLRSQGQFVLGIVHSCQFLEGIVRDAQVHQRFLAVDCVGEQARRRSKSEDIAWIEFLNHHTLDLAIIHVNVLIERIEDKLNDVINVAGHRYCWKAKDGYSNPSPGGPMAFWKC